MTTHDALVSALRNAMGGEDFDAAWAEGAALSTTEAIAYALRGRGERKRPSSGWGSLTPTELDVVRLVADGLPNKDIADSDVRLTANRADTSPPRLQQARADLAGAARSGSRTSRQAKMRLWADVLPMVCAAF